MAGWIEKDALSPASIKKTTSECAEPNGYVTAQMCSDITTVVKSYSARLRAAVALLADALWGANKCSASPVASRTHPHRSNRKIRQGPEKKQLSNSQHLYYIIHHKAVITTSLNLMMHSCCCCVRACVGACMRACVCVRD